MNPDRYIHRITVSRNTGGRNETWTTVADGVSVLLEPIKAKRKEWVLGRWPLAQYQMSWGTEDLRDGDRVTVDVGPLRATAKTFILAYQDDDTGRNDKPYQTAILEERK